MSFRTFQSLRQEFSNSEPPKTTLRRSTINILLHKNTQSIESIALAKKMALKIKKNIQKIKKKIHPGDRISCLSPHHPRKRTGTVINITKSGKYSVKWDNGRVSKATVSSKYVQRV